MSQSTVDYHSSQRNRMPLARRLIGTRAGTRGRTLLKKRKYTRRPVSRYVRRRIARGARPSSYRYRRRYGAGVGTAVNTRKRYVQENKSMENQVISLQMPGRKVTAMALARANMSMLYYRVQGVTQYDTNFGFYPIAQRTVSSLNGMVYTSPMHLWEITSVCNYDGSQIFNQPSVGWGVGWTSSGGTGTVVLNALNSQASAGTLISNASTLQLENVASSSSFHGAAAFRSAFHAWTNIKMNLYGVRSRATRYSIQVVMFKDSDSTDPLANITSNIASSAQQTEQKCCDMIDYLVKPFVYNNILLGDVQARQYIKVLKSYDVTIDPIQTTEYGGQAATPHIQTVNLFLRHNKNRRFDWLDTGGQSAPTSTANWEQNINGVQCRVNHKNRLYLMIRAMAPTTSTTTFTADPDPINEPSYDLIMRHKYLKPV